MNRDAVREVPPSRRRAAGDPLVGQVIDGRYRLVRRIGAGGMGVVYDGRHEVTGRPVAVKLLHPSAAYSSELLERFAREARTGAAIGHPNIVEVLDAGKLANGTPFLVMERLCGEPLSEVLLRETRLTAERTVEIVGQVASALDALHAHGIVHRDVKTDNLFIEKSGQVKLLDFGLAVFTDGLASARLTRDGVVNGTPQYLPPEIFDGAAPNVAWDVYALATVAFELLTGVVPFEGSNAIVTLYAKRETVAPRLADCVDGYFPDELERVIRRGLEREPTRRQASPGELAAQLASALGVQNGPSIAPLELSAPSSAASEAAVTSPLGGWRRMGRAPLVAAAFAAVLCITWLAFAQPQPDGARSTASVPPDPAATLLSAVPAASERDLETDEAADVMGSPVVEPTSAQRAAHHRARDRAATAVPPAPVPSAEIVPELIAPIPAVEETSGPDLVREGTSALMRGRIPDAIDLLHRATLRAPESAPAWRGLGLANERMGRRADARHAYARYLELAPTAPDADEVERRLESL